jgi:hypothetical protein
VLADLYRNSGHDDFASFYYAEALDIDPENRDAKSGLLAGEQALNSKAAVSASSLDNTGRQH